MRHLPAYWTAALFAGGVVLLLGLASARNAAELENAQWRTETQAQLADVASRLEKEIDSVVRALTVAARTVADSTSLREAAGAPFATYLGWSYDGEAVEFDGESLIDLPSRETLDGLPDSSTLLVGPLTTPQGQDVILLQVPAGDGDWRLGVTIELGALWSSVGLFDVVRAGMETSITGAEGIPIYWTSPEPLADPVTSDAHVGGTAWNLRAAPRGGWSTLGVLDAGIVVAVLLGILYALTFARLAEGPTRLEKRIGHLDERLRGKDDEVSTLLSRRLKLEAKLESSLTVDLSTGLPNRGSFIEHLQTELARCRRESGAGLLVAVFQLPKLETIGQSMGSAAVEGMLCELAEQLRSAHDGGTLIARVADKALALSVPLPPAASISEIAERFSATFDDRFKVGSKELYSPIALGIATTSDGYAHAHDLLANAGIAATTAEEDGERWSEFRQETKDERIGLLQLEADLQRAIDDKELRLFFQPIVSIAEGNIIGLESLLRWQHPTESWISPERFLAIAETMGQMHRISEWILRQAVSYGKQWAHLREVPLYLTVNLTPRDLNRSVCNLLFDLLDESNLPPQCIRIEVTENAVVRDFRVAARLIREFNDRGVRVLLDDFGTGYSSLSYLRDLPFHAVKIDKSFVQRMTTEARDLGLVKAIVDLVHYLGMECVAEGIETQEQLDLIGMVNCDYGQGYFFSRPIPAHDIEPIISRGGHHHDQSRMRAS